MQLLELEEPIVCRIVGRVNRFVVAVRAGGEESLAHINNTGRLLEYIKGGKTGYCLPHRGKTRYRLIAVEDIDGAALIDTQLQMKSFEVAVQGKVLEWAQCDLISRSPEVGRSKLDYLLRCRGRETFTELKSAVLRQGDYAMYPDCPTPRGRRHIMELIELSSSRVRTLLVFVAGLRGVKAFKPNTEGDPEVARLLKNAVSAGVVVKGFSIFYDPSGSRILLDRKNLRIEI
ncbi:MAG: DNA/RNA nuclease SfsA [Infirmifilum sp.]